MHASAKASSPRWKTVDFDGFVEIIDRIEESWFPVVKFPEE